MTSKIVLALHIPPPIHGASMVGKKVCEIVTQTAHIDGLVAGLSASEKVSDFGSFSLRRAWNYLRVISNVIFLLIKNPTAKLYITPGFAGFALLRDFLIVSVKKVVGGDVFVHCHSNEFSKTDNTIYRFMRSWIVTNSTLIVLSNWHKSQFSTKIIAGAKFTYVLPNCVVDDFQWDAEHAAAASTEKRLLFLSNLMEKKGVMEVLQFALRCREQKKNYKFFFAGGWSNKYFKEICEDYIFSNNLQDTVLFYGQVSGSEKRNVLSAADVLLFPTRYEGEVFPLVILEAMKCGLSIVSRRHASIPEMTSDEFSLLIEKTMCQEFEAICEFIDSAHDRSLVAQRHYEECFSEKKFRSKLIEILES